MTGVPKAPPEGDDPMRGEVGRFAARRRRWREEGGRTLAVAATLAGVGWVIVVPAVLGFGLGHWLDRRFGGGVTFAAGLGFLGLVVGCVTGWRRVSARLDPERPPGGGGPGRGADTARRRKVS